ncbi:hypothetical protein CYMTET_29756 [Cymbomonas tetramitiformis]|uniref:CBS domain-containing protein n=1 Tax=Cymbomonas tetramitiformis TaxID=36881 RepID=A0AAE0KUL9_9CHLO|nr:hypothetical protein CYMTET_29756 [Cymbomonas tetramitiformis]
MDTCIQTIIDEGFLFHHLADDGSERVNHRIAITDEQGTIISILSQSDIIAYIYQHREKALGDLRHLTVEKLGMCATPVFCIQSSVPAIEAFRQMNEENVSAMAVVNDQRVLIANISVSDLREVSPMSFEYLALPILDFLMYQNTHKEKVVANYTGDSLLPISCLASTTLEHIMERLTTNKVHRVYEVDDHDRAVGVITITDVLVCLLKLCSSNIE